MTTDDLKHLEKLLYNEQNQYFGSSVDELVDGLFTVIRCTTQFERIMELLHDYSKQLPFDLILKIEEIARMHEIYEIEKEWEAPGFNDWYKKTFGKTVKEVRKGGPTFNNQISLVK